MEDILNQVKELDSESIKEEIKNSEELSNEIFEHLNFDELNDSMDDKELEDELKQLEKEIS